MKDFFTIYITKITIFFLRKLKKGGTNLPGKIALKLNPNILSKVAKGYKIIFITGTNGKTTTTSMIYNALKLNGNEVITNYSGANMLTGIVTTFIENYKKNINNSFAIIEVDEANLKLVTKNVDAFAIVITNLFRDQLDRYGEVYSTLEKIMEGVKKSETLILNGDEPLFGDLQVSNEKLFFGLQLKNNGQVENNVEGKFCIKCKNPYSYNFIAYNHLGDYFCENCGYSRPKIDFLVDEIIEMNDETSHIKIDDLIINLNLSGLYNIYNAICAYSVLRFLNVEKNIISSSFSNQESSFGRQEVIKILDKEIKIMLVKNPAGYNEALNSLCLSEKQASIAFLLNDNYADGRDISWIWDVNFEKINNFNASEIFIGGKRNYDMAIRLKIAGFPKNKFLICDNFENLLNKIEKSNENYIFILATYTAMIDFRKLLQNKGYIKKMW